MFWSKSDENYTVQKVAADIQCTYIRLMYSFYGFIFLSSRHAEKNRENNKILQTSDLLYIRDMFTCPT